MFSRKNKSFKLLSQGPGRLSENSSTDSKQQFFGVPGLQFLGGRVG